MSQQNLFTEKAKRAKGKKAEEKIQIAFCTYVKLTRPDIIFNCDLASGMKLTMGQAVKAKQMRSSRSQTDFFMAEPKGQYHGFFLELKKDKSEVYNVDGSYAKKLVKVKKKGIIIEEYDHVQEQVKMIGRLKGKGYYADFGLGLDDCISKFTEYMKLS